MHNKESLLVANICNIIVSIEAASEAALEVALMRHKCLAA